jgi:hypothetical protein
VQIVGQLGEPRPVGGGSLRGTAGEPQEEVVVVGKDDRCARSGTRKLVVGVNRALEQLNDLVQVGKPFALPAVKHEMLDSLALRGDRLGRWWAAVA